MIYITKSYFEKHTSHELADRYFAERNRDIQIVSIVSNQGQLLNDIKTLNKKITKMYKKNITALNEKMPAANPYFTLTK